MKKLMTILGLSLLLTVAAAAPVDNNPGVASCSAANDCTWMIHAMCGYNCDEGYQILIADYCTGTSQDNCYWGCTEITGG